jgi:hypothetical protein
MNTSQIYANMTVHPTNASYMLIGLQDNEAAIYEGNPGFRRIGSLGDGFHTAMNLPELFNWWNPIILIEEDPLIAEPALGLERERCLPGKRVL